MKIGKCCLPVIVTLSILLGAGPALGGPSSSKANGALMTMYGEYTAWLVQGGVPPFRTTNSLAHVMGNRVVVDLMASGDLDTLKASLSALGMVNISVFGRVVSGELPMGAIPALDTIASLRFARPSSGERSTGSVASEGDQAIRADVARASFGVTGEGVQVGVLSDSFDCLRGAAADVASNDLSPVTVLQELPDCTDATDEGRAMLQIVHDVAPGARLSFATAFTGMAGFANNIRMLKANGAKVIVDDVLYAHEPMFQDGIVAQAVDEVVSQGVAYFSSAGNSGRLSYESAFRPGSRFAADQFPPAPGAPPGVRFFGGIAHNFAPSGPAIHMQRITIPSNRTLSIHFQWDSPFFSSGGAGSTNDVDIYLLNDAGTMVLAASADTNVGGDAVEVFSITNQGPTADVNVMIMAFEGPLPGLVKYTARGAITIQQFDTQSSTSFGHANARGAIAVGAADFEQTPAFGVNPPVRESFSSAGGTPILFDTAGNRLGAPIVRRKPEIVAPDGGSTTFFPDPGSPRFFGTSAAAPHAAGVAALMLAKQPDLTPGVISAVLARTALDMGSPGFDFDSGFGLVQADAALGALPVLLMPMVAAVLPSSRSVAVGDTATAFATVINTGSATASGVSVTLGSAIPASFSYQTTDPATNQPTGSLNTPVDIRAGESQTFVLSITPVDAILPADVPFNFAGTNTLPAAVIRGVNTLLLSASPTPVPDLVAMAATPSRDLITNIPGERGTGVFVVAAVNIGAPGSITVTAEAGDVTLPLSVALCQTNPVTSACLAPPAPSVTVTINAGETPTFAIFVTGRGVVPFDPATNRVFVTFKDAGQVIRGSTSTAVRTQ